MTSGRGSALRIALGGRRIDVTRSILGFEFRGGKYRQKVADYELVRPRDVVLQIEASVTPQKKLPKTRRRHILP